VIEAGTVAEGLRRFHDDVVDVVVIDLHLPDGTGHDLARWLWQQQPQLPLVMITSDPEAAGVARLRQVDGRSTMLIKPFSISALLDAISVVVADPPEPAHA
jgi:DNA-binding response OmpR family regulator